jgi:hypothetical protein
MPLRSLALILLLLAPGAQAQTAQLVGDLPRKDGRPLQALAGLESEYGVVRTSEGIRLRTILTRPAGARGKLPAILLTQWVSCSSLDFDAGRPGLLKALAERSGAVLIRIERSGTGDSEGQPCSALDYDTEVRHYREALDQLRRHPWVDQRKIVIFGSSLGSTTAPLVADGKQVAGIVVQGGGALTYLERMIAFDRLFLERSGKYAPSQVHGEMLKRIAFHTEYLVGKKTPDALRKSARTSPACGRMSAAALKPLPITAGPMAGTGRPRRRISSAHGHASRRRCSSSIANMTSSRYATVTK